MSDIMTRNYVIIKHCKLHFAWALRILAGMEATDRPLLATLAYYGALRRPLTLVDIYERLIVPERLGCAQRDFTVGALGGRVDALATQGVVVAEDGCYALADTPRGFGERFVERQKESVQKYQRLLKYTWWLQAVPYVRTLAASGSLALASAGPLSDWDMFVIAKAGRLYTARAGLLLATFVMGRLRTKRMRVASDKFCFNHFITTDGLALRHRSMFTAHAMIWLIPVFDHELTLQKLWQANQWIGDYTVRSGDRTFVRRRVATSRLLNGTRRIFEALLSSPVGGVIEKMLRLWMQKRIRRNPVTHERGGRIVAADRELEFHPHSFEAVALARYNASLVRMGLGQYAEQDSGLTR